MLIHYVCPSHAYFQTVWYQSTVHFVKTVFTWNGLKLRSLLRVENLNVSEPSDSLWGPPQLLRVPRRCSCRDMDVFQLRLPTRPYQDDISFLALDSIAPAPAYSNAVRKNEILTSPNTSVEV